MPSETFFKLSEDKKEKVLNAAKKEFSRVPIERALIKNIVEEANIARGSFYQYFEDKEDLLIYIVKKNSEKMNTVMQENLKDNNGDLFNWYILSYDCMVKNFKENDEFDLYKKIFENIKASDEKFFTIISENYKPKNVADYYDLIDKTNLNINSKEDLRIVSKILNIITRNAVLTSFRNKSEKESRENFLKELEYVKYGILKRE